MTDSAPDPRRLYAELALPYIPHLTQLVDKNPYSPTYGCFDREYWHYRTLDFPCGMNQEFVLPFAQLYLNPLPGNKYHGWERLREIAVAGINYAITGSHPDGTCDDYYPFEQAMGALVFSTYACTEAYLLLGLKDERMLAFFRKRGDHLIAQNETGQLSNHQAFAALAAYNIFLVTGDEKYRRLSDERKRLTLSWQNKDEGWFQEYEGADPRLSHLHHRLPGQAASEKRRRLTDPAADQGRRFRLALHAPRRLLRRRVRQPQHLSFLPARLRVDEPPHPQGPARSPTPSCAAWPPTSATTTTTTACVATWSTTGSRPGRTTTPSAPSRSTRARISSSGSRPPAWRWPKPRTITRSPTCARAACSRPTARTTASAATRG